MSREPLRPQALVLRSEAATIALRDRAEGRSRNGTVSLRHFDEGVVTTLGATIDEDTQTYWLTISLIDGPPGAPVDKLTGEIRVPIVFSIPEDVFAQYQVPIIVVRREGMTPALNRWMPGQLQYRAPSYNAYTAVYKKGTVHERRGFDQMDQVQMATPFDIDYTISLISRHRGVKGGQRNQSHRTLDHVLRIYQPYSMVKLIDSIGDERTYEATMESVTPLDSIPEVSERIIGFSLSLRVSAEIDLAPTETYRTLLQTNIKETLL